MSLDNFTYKINTPELEAYFQQFGKEHYIDAEEINSIVDTLKLMSNNVASSGFIEKKTHGFVGQNYEIEKFFKWALDNILYTNLTKVVLNVPYSATGKTRFERIAANNENTFIRVVGTESSSAAALPDLPENTIELTHYLVRDNSIDTPVVVNPSGVFVEKETFNPLTYNNTGVVGSIEIGKRSALKITGTVSEIGNILKNNAQDYYTGQFFVLIDNTTSGNIKLPQLNTSGGSGTIAWFHPDGQNYFTTKDEIVLFVLDYIGSQKVYRRLTSGLKNKSVTLEKLQDFPAKSFLARNSETSGQGQFLDVLDVLIMLGLDDAMIKSYLLDGSNKIKVEFLPNSVMELKGNWNASTNTPTLANGTGNSGDIYEVTTAGSVNFGDGTIAFAVGDFVVYGANGKWYNSPNTYPTKVVVTVSSSITLDSTYNGKTLRFTGASIEVTIPTGLGLNWEIFLDNDTVSNIVFVLPSSGLTVFAPSGTKLVGGGTGYMTMTTTSRLSIKGDFID